MPSKQLALSLKAPEMDTPSDMVAAAIPTVTIASIKAYSAEEAPRLSRLRAANL
jgi:hypothetical protein